MPPWARSSARRITPISRPKMSSPHRPERLPATRRLTMRVLVVAAAPALHVTSLPATAEVSTLRISYGYGILYLPLMVMDREQLIERRAKAAGIPDVKVEWK